MSQDRPVVAVFDEPPPIVMMERRCTPDRRTRWRGGRRDRDWLTRPPHAWSRSTLSSRTRARLAVPGWSELGTVECLHGFGGEVSGYFT